jgi:hypothetical protein
MQTYLYFKAIHQSLTVYNEFVFLRPKYVLEPIFYSNENLSLFFLENFKKQLA